MNRDAQKGMSLLEVMVAVAVFAGGCMAIARATGIQVSSFDALEQKNIAGWVADNQLSSMMLNGIRPSALWMKGSEEMAGHLWFWRARGRQTTDSTINVIEIEVSEDADFSHIAARLRTWRG